MHRSPSLPPCLMPAVLKGCSCVGYKYLRQNNTEKMSPVYICQNDKPMTSLALSTAHQVKTNLCQPHSLKGCHIFVINLPKTSVSISCCRWQSGANIASTSKHFGNASIYLVKLQILSNKLVQNVYMSSVLKVRSEFAVRFMEFHEKTRIALYESKHLLVVNTS